VPAVVPVLFNTMPFTGSAAAVALPASILWNVKPLAPMNVSCTFSAAALTEAMLLPVP
jgi:hypothetical protein